MSESESDLSRDVDESMRMFERSQVGRAGSIAPIRPERVLWVLDGSPQDNAAAASAAYLRQHCDATVLVMDGRDQDSQGDDEIASQWGESVPGIEIIARPEGDSYDAMLEAIKQHQIDLLIVPCPFGRSFEHVGVDSAGTVIDVLLSRCPVPLLVIRRDDQHLGDCAMNIRMMVGSQCDVEVRAAGWVFGLAAKNATVTLNLVIDKEQFTNMRSIIEAMQPGTQIDTQQFAEALTKSHQSLHASMSNSASDLELEYHLIPQAGEDAPPNPLNDQRQMLLVMPLEVDDRFGQGFVHDRVRRSPHPVLVVPGHVPT